MIFMRTVSSLPSSIIHSNNTDEGEPSSPSTRNIHFGRFKKKMMENNNETEYVQGVYTKHPTLKKESSCN
jgi:hypothetical protein